MKTGSAFWRPVRCLVGVLKRGGGFGGVKTFCAPSCRMSSATAAASQSSQGWHGQTKCQPSAQATSRHLSNKDRRLPGDSGPARPLPRREGPGRRPAFQGGRGSAASRRLQLRLPRKDGAVPARLDYTSHPARLHLPSSLRPPLRARPPAGVCLCVSVPVRACVCVVGGGRRGGGRRGGGGGLN